jgi:very-short-patch-repair endonuclease
LGNGNHALRFVEHVGQDEEDMNRKSSTASAREMRKNFTDAELKLWKRLRNRLTYSEKFRRQQPIGKYIVDFVCLEKKLIVEVDGGQHGEQIAYDNERTAWLESEGYRVLRFWNIEVLEDVEIVLDVIVRALDESELYHPHLTLFWVGQRRARTLRCFCAIVIGRPIPYLLGIVPSREREV